MWSLRHGWIGKSPASFCPVKQTCCMKLPLTLISLNVLFYFHIFGFWVVASWNRYSLCKQSSLPSGKKLISYLFFAKRGPLRQRCPYSGFFWSVFSRIWIILISPYSVQIQGNKNQKSSKYGPFSRSGQIEKRK